MSAKLRRYASFLNSNTDPELARTALDTVERTARTAIDELRGLLGVLRAEPGSEESAGGADDTSHTASPGLADLPELVEHTRSAGLEATFAVHGGRIPLGQCRVHLPQPGGTEVDRVVGQPLEQDPGVGVADGAHDPDGGSERVVHRQRDRMQQGAHDRVSVGGAHVRRGVPV